MLLFRLEQGQVRQKVPGAGPLEKDLVGSLGVQVDEPVSLLNGDEVIGRFAVRIPALGQPNRRPGDQQFPAAPGVFYVDGLHRTVYLHLRNEAVGPAHKLTTDDRVIFHSKTSFMISIMSHIQYLL